jgi:hypothetical protein
MSGALSLPPEVERWPSDPYELLGVSQRAAPDEVRSAYERLSAAFDPARAPEQCRRLRTARDVVLRDLDLLQLLETPLTLQLQPDLPLTPPRPESQPDHPDMSEALRAAVPSPDAIAAAPLGPSRNPVAILWQLALSGREAEAYHGLVSALEQNGATEDVCLRLHWLLTALPELDRQRSPRDWLARGLRAGGLSGAQWELYRRALAEDDEEGRSPRCAGLLEAPAEPEALVDLALARWRSAARGQQWDVLTADLQVLRERLPASERLAWARLWAGALDHLVWSDAKAARQLAGRCSQALGEIRADPPQVKEVRKRQQQLRDLAAGWRALRPEPEVPPPLLALIPPSWSQPFAELRPKLLAFLAEVLRVPRSLLRALDATRQQPAVLAQFGRLLERLQETLPPTPLEARSSSDLSELVCAFFDTADRSHYRTFRLSLLDFCLREAIAPEAVAELTEHSPYYQQGDGHLSQTVGGDEPLRLVYLAHRLFWV